MIKLKDNEKLYFIANEGCDDSTYGIAIISDEDFPKFKRIVKNLNKNSTYGCQPTISVYIIDPDELKEGDPELADDSLLYLDDTPYEPADDSIWSLFGKAERVI